MQRASFGTLGILKRARSSKMSTFSFWKSATFNLQTALTIRILKKVILSWNQKSVFLKPLEVSRKFECFGVFFIFFDLVSMQKKSCFLPEIHHKRGFIRILLKTVDIMRSPLQINFLMQDGEGLVCTYFSTRHENEYRLKMQKY